MDTKDKTPPASSIDEELSAEEKAIREAAKGETKPEVSGTDDDLPKVRSEQAQS